MTDTQTGTQQHSAPVKLPRVAITYCTQCRWMLRAAYFAQELLSTFNTSIGEIALIPATGGIFTVQLTYIAVAQQDGSSDLTTQEVLIWDRKTDGGFPEAKILKQRIRNHIEPDRNLGHSDTPSARKGGTAAMEASKAAGEKAENSAPIAGDKAKASGSEEPCEDCA